jgi:endonuclease/exonuclease/phosphatase family metal-dependent hydrolase
LPVISCGDFNDTPSSFSYYVGTKGFKDAFISSGFGIGRTYNGPIPALRIDFIMYKAPLSPLRTRVIKNPVSDHFPVVSEFEWQKED